MLQFRDIKQNSSVYILNKSDVTVKTGKITSASFPKMEFNPQTGQQQMMITFGIEAEGKSSTYAIPESSSTVDAGDLVIATEKIGLLHELENMNNAGVKKHTIIFLSFFNRNTPFCLQWGNASPKKGELYPLKELPFASHNCLD